MNKCIALLITGMIFIVAGIVNEARAAERNVTHDTYVQWYLSIASKYWHETPEELCPNGYEVVVAPLPRGLAGEAGEPGCWMVIDPGYYTDEEFNDYECAIVMHEYGHSTGHGHVANINNIMYPTIYADNAPLCTKAGIEWYAAKMRAEEREQAGWFAAEEAGHKRGALRYARRHRHAQIHIGTAYRSHR